MIKINSYKMYLDGGSILVDTNRGTFCFDYRLCSQTRGRLYRGYPEKDNSNLISNSKELESDIWGELGKEEGFTK